jgi:hypothetical protein
MNKKELLTSLSEINYPALQFIDSYLQVMRCPKTFQNHKGQLVFNSDRNVLLSRKRALTKYLTNPNEETGKTIPWGQTILSEIITCSLIKTIYSQELNRSSYNSLLAPTSIDISYNNYQKGADIIISKILNHRPLIGIDVTLGEKRIIKDKRRRPGIQLLLAIPVIVLPLKDIIVPGYNLSFVHFLNDVVVPDINQGCFSLINITENQLHAWKNVLRPHFKEALEECNFSLKKCSNTKIAEYPFLRDIFQQIDAARQLFCP